MPVELNKQEMELRNECIALASRLGATNVVVNVDQVDTHNPRGGRNYHGTEFRVELSGNGIATIAASGDSAAKALGALREALIALRLRNVERVAKTQRNDGSLQLGYENHEDCHRVFAVRGPRDDMSSELVAEGRGSSFDEALDAALKNLGVMLVRE